MHGRMHGRTGQAASHASRGLSTYRGSWGLGASMSWASIWRELAVPDVAGAGAQMLEEGGGPLGYL